MRATFPQGRTLCPQLSALSAAPTRLSHQLPSERKRAEPTDIVQTITLLLPASSCMSLRASVHTGVAIRIPRLHPPGESKGAEGLPLPVAEEGRLSAPQPRLWRAVAKQARERQMRQGGRSPRSVSLPLPVAEEGRLSAPQPRLWQTAAKQVRERSPKEGKRPISLFALARKEKWVLLCAGDGLQTGHGGRDTSSAPVCALGHLPLKGKAAGEGCGGRLSGRRARRLRRRR